MKKSLLLIIIVALLFFACGDPNELSQDNLQGTWKFEKFIKNGKEIPGDLNIIFRFSNDGKALQVADGKNVAGKYTLVDKTLTFTVPVLNETLDFVYNIIEFSENKMILSEKQGTVHLKRIDKMGIEEEEFSRYYSGEKGISGTLADEMKLEETLGYMRSISSAIYAYYADYEKFPMGDGTDMIKCISVAHLQNPPTKDSWGNIWIYKVSPDGEMYILRSNGKDGVTGPGKSKKPGDIAKDDPLRFDYDIVIVNGEFSADVK